MNKDRKVLYAISILIFAVLLIALFIDVGSSKIVAACLLLPMCVQTILAIKKRSALSLNKKEVLLLVAIIGALYAVLIEMTGLSFGYHYNPYIVNSEKIFTVIIPLVVIIVASELIRSVMLAQKVPLVGFITYLSCTIAEVLSYSSLVGITSFNMFMTLVGMTMFPAMCANIFYHYVSKRYGALPNIAFRIITTLYIYFLPYTSAISDALVSCIKIILPIVMLAFVSALFEKKKKNAKPKKGDKLVTVGSFISILVIISAAMLISCQFRFGALVIATDSMTGEINRGDMIIYEQYDNQRIKDGQVIVFTDGDSQAKIVHRVIRIENIDGQTRYYTKGDANPDPDSGYRTDADIVGLTDVKIAAIGYPSLLIRDLIDGRT